MAGKGGPSHRRAQGIIRDYYVSQGMVAIIEGFLVKHFDVLVYDPVTRKTKDLEYETGNTQQALRNIFIGSQLCHEVITVSSDSRVLNSIRARAERAFGASQCSNRQFKLLEEFLPQRREGSTPIYWAEQSQCGIKSELPRRSQ